jgi:ribokinase
VQAPRFPQPGETIGGGDLHVIPGGKGANQAVAAARLGTDVSMLGRLGHDNFGDALLDNLRQNNVDVSRVVRDHSSTGTAIIIVDENGQNSIVLSPGANGNVTPADVDAASFLHHDLILLQLEIPTTAVLRAAQRAKENNLRVILDPAPAKEIPDELILLADFIIPNETELGLLTRRDVRDISSAKKAARQLLERGARNVIVTLGSNGALIVNRETDTHVNAYEVKVVDTTAAGDAFVGGFATALLRSKPIEESVQIGCACGALAATKFGAQPSLPTEAEVDVFMGAQPK